MPCFFFEDCDYKKTDWCYENKAQDYCRVAKIAFYNKSINKMLECIDKLDKQSERLDKVEGRLNAIKRRLL